MADDLVLRIYADDDITTYVELGTAAAHPNPYLQRPEQFAEAEIDPKEGRARIGRINVRVIDPQSGATQAVRFVTALLGSADGYSKINGHRARLETDAGVVVQDGICAGATLLESYAGFEFALEDFRARGIKVRAFTKSGTSTVFPRGVLGGFGAFPDAAASPLGPTLVPATKPQSAAFVRSGGTAWGLIVLHDEEKTADRILTDAMLSAAAREWDEDTGLYLFRNVEIWWRAEGTANAWTKHAGMPAPPEDGGWIGEYRHLFQIGGDTIEVGDAEHNLIGTVWLSSVGASLLPADGARIEFMVVYTGEPTDDYPFHFEGSWGEFARNLLRGDYSPRDPRIPYDEAALLAIDEPVLIRQTEPEPDLREYFEKLCKALGVAPALDSAGAVSPVRTRLPDENVPLPILGDTNCEAAPGWEHPITGAVTVVEFDYPRYTYSPPDQDPQADRSSGDGVRAVQQPVRVEPLDAALLDVMGEQVHEVDAFPFGALGGVDGQPASGDVSNESGFQIAYGMGHQLIDRLAFGGQSSFVRAMRSDADVAALRVGDWVLDQRSWAPHYAQGERGRNHLAQVMAIQDLNPAWREIRLLDAAPYANPLLKPTLGGVSAAANGVVTLTILGIPAGAEARVDYVVSDTQPAADSGAWTFAGRIAAAGNVQTPPLPAGSTVWLRARSEAVGKRPSLWALASSSVGTPLTPRIQTARLSFAADGSPVVEWTVNGAAAGVRVYTEIHDIRTEPTGVWDDTREFSAAAGGGTITGLGLGLGDMVTIHVEPWTGWDAATSAVTGTAGAIFELSGFPEWAEGGTFDIVIDDTTGHAWVTPNALSSRVRSWRFKLVDGSVQTDNFIDPAFVDAADDGEFSGGPSSFGQRVDTGVAITAGNAAYLVGYFFEGPAADAATQETDKRSPRIRYWRPRGSAGPDTAPILDEDAGTLFLYPNRNLLADSVKWVKRTDREPTLAEIQAGTVSTEETINVHTFDPAGGEQQVWVGLIPYTNADGTGTAGSRRVRQWTFTAGEDQPGIAWMPVQGDNPDREAIQITVTDDGDQVALFHRQYEEGAATKPAYTRTPASPGWSTDPLIHVEQVTVPLEGAPDVIVEAYAIDPAGNTSNRIALRIDAGTHPSATLKIEADSTGRVWITPNSTDADAGSWRARVAISATEVYPTVGYVDESGESVWEGAGSLWGTRVDTGLVLVGDVEAYLSGFAYRTTNIAAASQQASRRSPEIRDWTGAMDADALALRGLREISRTATDVTYGWENGPAVAHIFIYDELAEDGPDANVWNTEREPDTELAPPANTYTTPLPPEGKVRRLQFEPRDADLNAGRIWQILLSGIPLSNPVIDYVGQAPGNGPGTTDVVAVIRDEVGRSGTLHAWVNAGSPHDADPDGPADGFIDLPQPSSVTAADVWTLTGGGTAQLFDELPIHAGRGKRIALEFIASDGASSGKVDKLLHSWTDIIDEATGGLVSGAVERANIALGAVGTQQLAVAGVERENIVDAAIDAAKIANGVVDVAKFAAGIEPVGIHTGLALPTTKSTEVIYWNGKLYRWSGTAYTAEVPTVDLSGKIETVQIALSAITEDLLAAGAITAPKISDAAVTAAKVAASAITETKISDGAIATPKLAASAVTAAKIAAGTITANELAAGSITTVKLAAGAVTAAKIAAGTITASEIAAGAITAVKLAAGSVETDKLAAAAVTAAKIAADTITAGQIAAGAISTSELSAGAVAAGKIAAGAINAASLIVDGIITAAKLAVSELSEIAPDVGIVISGELRNASGTRFINLDAVSGGIGTNGVFIAHDKFTLYANGNAVFAGELTAETILTGQIVQSGNIGDGAVDRPGIITDGTITAAKIQVAALSELATDLGIIVSGVLRNVGNVAGVRLDTGSAIPTSWRRYLDLAADGAQRFIGVSHPTTGATIWEIRADGTAIWPDDVLNSADIATFSFSATSQVFDQGTPDLSDDVYRVNYSMNWTLNKPGVDNASSYRVAFDYYRNGVKVARQEGLGATNNSHSFSHDSDQRPIEAYVVMFLYRFSDGAIIQTRTSQAVSL